MATILPTTLNEVMENENFSITFSAQLEQEEILESININSDLPDYININESTVSGMFKNEFNLNKDSLKYRKYLTYGVASSFSELPEKGTYDLYSFETPKELKKEFNINVTLKYTLSGSPMEISSNYILRLQGSWDSFKYALLEYI